MPATRARRASTALDSVPFSVFEDIERRVAHDGGADPIRLHQGKTWFAPCVRPRDWGRAEFELLAHEHASPAGSVTLKRRIVAHLQRMGRCEATEDRVVISCGATHGVGMALQSVLDPDDEVLVLSPQWLFAAGLIEAARGHTVEVPVFLELARNPRFDFVAALEARVTERTRAVYFNSPNNPTGFALGPEAHEALADFADRHDLWIIADNAYETYDFTGHGFIDIARYPSASDRTFSVYTFSKSYAMPGYRVGFVVLPESMVDRMPKWALYSVYAVSTASQFAAIEALATPDEVLEDRRCLVRDARDMVRDQLEVPHTTVDGGLYTFLDPSGWVGDGDYLGASIRAGVSLAPGDAFGGHCSGHARMCFTAVEPGRLQVAIERLNRVWRG